MSFRPACAGLALVFFMMFPGLPARADDVNSDLAIPQESNADQDAISAAKMKNEDVSNSDAQARKTPPKSEHYLELVPADEADEPGPSNAKEENVKANDAQERKTPPKNEHYLELVPSEEVDQPAPLKEKLKNGTHIYAVKEHESSAYGGIRIGSFRPSNLVGDSGYGYSTIYNNASMINVDFNYEKMLFKKVGIFGIRGDAGLFTTKGQGRFLHETGLIANESITLLGVPLAVGGVYQLQLWKKQFLIPFAEAGLDYIPFFEIRSDLTKFTDNIKFGGAPAAHEAFGGMIQLDFLNKDDRWQLYQDYGINHMYLTVDMRLLNGLSKTFDFTSTILEGGILVEF